MAEVLRLLSDAYNELITTGSVDVALIKLLISKALGYGILVFSVLVKLPQVAAVLRSRSADGLSALSVELESWALLVHAAYGALRQLPFSAYGEAVFLLGQDLLLLGLIYSYSRSSTFRRSAAVAVAAAAAGALATGRVSVTAAAAAYDLNNLVLLSARLPQIAKAFAARSTGQLSIVTYAANTAGCVARLFTTVQEGGGAAMLRSYCISLLLNAIIVAQILIFGNKGKAAPRQKRVPGKTA